MQHNRVHLHLEDSVFAIRTIFHGKGLEVIRNGNKFKEWQLKIFYLVDALGLDFLGIESGSGSFGIFRNLL